MENTEENATKKEITKELNNRIWSFATNVCFDDNEKIELCNLLIEFSYQRKKFTKNKETELEFLEKTLTGTVHVTKGTETIIISPLIKE